MRAILELRIGGRRYLIGSRTGEIEDDGDARPVYPGLPDELPLLSVTWLEAAEVPSLVLDNVRIPGLDALSLGERVSAELATLATENTDWTERRPVLRFEAESWTRQPGERLRAELTADTSPLELQTIPAATAELGPRTWVSTGAAARGIDGASYPIPFGIPGVWQDDNGNILSCPASPAYPTDGTNAGNRKLIVADGPVGAATVTIDDGDGTTATGTISRERDRLGRLVSIATVPALDPILPLGDRVLHATWDNAGGIIGETRSGPEMSAAELILWLLRRSSVRVDRPRWRAVLDELDAWRLDGCIEEPIQPWEYLLDAILPLLPVALSMGAEGWYPILYRYDWPTSAAVAHLEVRPGELYECTEASVLGQLTPSIRLRWAYDRLQQSFRMSSELTGDPADRAAGRSLNAYTIAAWARWQAAQDLDRPVQEPPSLELETDVVYDRQTALRILGYLSAKHALPQQRLVYPASPNLLDLPLGAPVLLSDAQRGLSYVPAQIVEMPAARQGGVVRVGFSIASTPLLPSWSAP